MFVPKIKAHIMSSMFNSPKISKEKNSNDSVHVIILNVLAIFNVLDTTDFCIFRTTSFVFFPVLSVKLGGSQTSTPVKHTAEEICRQMAEIGRRLLFDKGSYLI